MSLSSFGRVRSMPVPGARYCLLVGACVLVLGIGNGHAQGALFSDLLGGGFLDVGNTRFDNWQLLSLASSSGVDPDLAQIEVLPLAGDPANPGMQFVGNGQLAVAGANSLDLVFQYRATPLSGGATMVGHSLSLDSAYFPNSDGLAIITNELTDAGANPVASAMVIADFTSSVFQLVDSPSFADQPEVFVTTNLFLMGFSDADDVTLNAFTHRFTQQQVPEPASVFMFLAVGAVLVRLRRGASR